MSKRFVASTTFGEQISRQQRICRWCGDSFTQGFDEFTCSKSCNEKFLEYKEKQQMAKNKQAEKQAAEAEAKVAAQAQEIAGGEKKEAVAPVVAEKKEKGPAKMAHGQEQSKLNPPADALPEGWQYVWHDAYTYAGKNGDVTVRGHWEKAKKSPPKPVKAEAAPVASASAPATDKK